MKYKLTFTYPNNKQVIVNKEFKGINHLKNARKWKFNCLQICGRQSESGELPTETLLEAQGN